MAITSRGNTASVLNLITDLFEQYSIADFLIVLIILLGVVVAAVRWYFSHSERWMVAQCPKCGGYLHRIHRSLFDRLLSATLLPYAHRFECNNEDCDWTGLRTPLRMTMIRF